MHRQQKLKNEKGKIQKSENKINTKNQNRKKYTHTHTQKKKT